MREADTIEEVHALPLTEEQRVVAESLREKNLVLAGPGTGKTHTLVARVAHLMGARAGSEDAAQILILSFTRAVVRELHLRLRHADPHRLGYVRPVTFDSFATRLLSGVPELAEWETWSAGGYDDRIRAATRALVESEEAGEWLRRFDHVVVDEIQDLVYPRAELVTALIERVPSFDLFGDPAQGIYGWQQRGRDQSADRFVADLQARHGVELQVHSLEENHRMTPAMAERWRAIRPALLDLEAAAEELPTLTRMLGQLDTLGDVCTAAPMLATAQGRTAILCRTNAEAMIVSDELYETGVDHVLRRTASDRAVAGWLAQVCRGLRAVLDHRTFAERYGDVDGSRVLAPQDAWELLAAVGDADDRVELGRLSAAIKRGTLPDELTQSTESSLVVSTIHRAKGLEFDTVIVVQPESWRLELGDPGEEARVLFVAMTRARRDLHHMSPVDTAGWSVCDRTGRWFRCRGGQRWMTLGFEIRGDDLHRMHPAGAWLIDGDPGELQDYLATEVRRGDDAYLERIQDPGHEGTPSYALVHGDREIGVVGDEFIRALSLRLAGWGRRPNRWPRRFTGVRIEDVDTVVGLEGVGADSGLGASGLWLRPRPVGLANVRWD